MMIALISGNRDLYRLCRKVLVSMQLPSWILSTSTVYEANREYDFCIWDIDPGKAVPAYRHYGPDRHLFLVDPDDVSRFRETHGSEAPAIVLKPVSKGVLTAYLEVAFSFPARNTPSPKEHKTSAAERFLQTNLKLQRYEHDRSNFIALAAHDLRTPATALLGYCAMLLDRAQERLNDEEKAILRHMSFSASRLSRMSSDIFDLSVEGRRTGALDARREDIARCVEQAVHEVGPFVVDKEISVCANMGRCAEDLYFDHSLIERVLVNLLENACRFTPPKGTIEIRGYPFFIERRNSNAALQVSHERRTVRIDAPNSYRLDIRNSGVPIPLALLEGIFEQYVGTGRGSGCGLGLAISKAIVAEHGGSLWAENTDLGPTFSLVLPGERPRVPSLFQAYPRHAYPRQPLNDSTPVTCDAAV